MGFTGLKGQVVSKAAFLLEMQERISFLTFSATRGYLHSLAHVPIRSISKP